MRFILAFVLSLLTIPAAASSNDIMLEMIEFITEHSKYEYAGEPLPFIEIRNVDELCKAVYTPETLKLIKECSVVGYYDHSVKTVFIADTSGPHMVDEYFIEVVLFHELVHYLQYLNGEHLKVECMNALEVDAYRLQREYIEYMEYPDEQKPDPLFAMLVSSCGKNGWFSE